MKKSIFMLCLFLVVMVVLASCNKAITTDISPGRDVPLAQKEKQMPHKSGISLYQYEHIEYGTSLLEVENYLSLQGRLVAEFGTRGKSDYTAIYSFVGNGDEESVAEFTFSNDRLTARTQIGLQ